MEYTITVTARERELLLDALNYRRAGWTRERDMLDGFSQHLAAQTSNANAAEVAALGEKIRSSQEVS